MNRTGLELAGEFAAAGEPFVLATVVWRRGPSSGKQGAKAVIRPDGKVIGWLGGACAQPTVVREALAALEDGKPRLLALGMDGTEAREGVVSVAMACESEGAMEVYLEPMVPPPTLVVVGRSPSVTVLARMAAELGWETAIIDDGGDQGDHARVETVLTSLDFSALRIDERTFIVVATQGHYDEAALEAALLTPAGYVGLVASRKRADSVLEFLRGRGVNEDALSRVHAPAGLDLGQLEHEEMAVAILAELVRLRAAGGIRAGVATAKPVDAIDLVCGMTVDVATAHFHSEYEGKPVYFCAAGCQRRFEEDPTRYAEALQ